jgi:hypothetical protein
MVIRLNEHSNDSPPVLLRAAGNALADTFFQDCTVSPDDVVAKFFLLAETAPGAISIHCRDGLALAPLSCCASSRPAASLLCKESFVLLRNVATTCLLLLLRRLSLQMMTL